MFFNCLNLKCVSRIFIVLIYATVPVAVTAKSNNDPKQLFYESLALYEQGKIVEAVTKLEQLEKLDPANPNVVANLAQFSGEAGLYHKAAKYFKKLMRLEPNNIQAETGYSLYQSIILANGKKYAEAVNLLEKVVKKAPNHQSILWNLASFAAKLEKHEKALKYWSQLAKVEPKNMHVQSKIIQSYQALGDIENREQAINTIIMMHKENVDPRYIQQNKFCREQYSIGVWKVFVYQYFDPGSEDQYFYRYSATDHAGRERFWLSLGSYQATTEIARETGSIPTSARMYHLDYYDEAKHSTYGMYTRKPRYDELRDVARKIIVEKVAKMAKEESRSPE